MKHINTKRVRNGFSIFFITMLIIACNNDNPFHSVNYISKIDFQQMQEKHLSDFQLLRKRPKFSYGMEYIYANEDSLEQIFITSGLLKSTTFADSLIQHYLKQISVIMNEGNHEGFSIGDKFWWIENNDHSLSNIVFIRNNATFILSSSNSKNLKKLALSIDNDILNKVEYIEYSDLLLIPIIDSITSSKKQLRSGDTARITIHAHDPLNEYILYTTNGGMNNYSPNPKNIFTLINSRQTSETFSWTTRSYEFNVINESNLVSETVHLEIEMYE